MEFQADHTEDDDQSRQSDDMQQRIVFNRVEMQKLHSVKTYIDNNLDLELTIPLLARKFMISTTYLKLGFKQLCGSPIYQYVLQQRMERAKLLLSSGERVRLVAADIGYSLTGFSKVFKSYTGLSPIAFRNLHK
ncbi:helix-turn-helix transcriptional regulator [Chitinophaga agrisoli]|uniref:Helix-turn-helix transcriptional regulator n=1 Tax=Chitinophaga agrisoli TaxID=2607653 RepID=A0A5B2VND2_9BACT|nr:AraC family transcriptional regulator [Chitinophaga agrisoli]KAA2239727.1 helix-turn-helix transcriptional regulator [Chitinophaga agrisoli]